MGEGWHNNHHAYQSSARQGFRWWEIDLTYYILSVLSWFGVVWGLKTPTKEVLRNEQRLGSRVINRAAEQLAAHFDPEWIALAITSSFHGPTLSTLQEMFLRAQPGATDVLVDFDLPQMPTRTQILAAAKAIFARTRSLDEIVDRAYVILLAAVGTRVIRVEHTG